MNDNQEDEAVKKFRERQLKRTPSIVEFEARNE
jgi:hypothetical protein